MRKLISSRSAALDFSRSDLGPPALWAAFLTLLVAGPWLGSGYVFGTDWPGPRRFNFPTELSSSAPLQAALTVASDLVSGEVTSKLFIVGFLFAASLLAYRAAPAGGFAPRAAASAIYLLNPFVYGRFHYGQLYLIAAYAVLPWVAIRLRHLFLTPGYQTALLTSASLWLLGIFSPHLLLVASLLTVALTVTYAAASRRQLAYLKRLAIALLVSAGATLVACAYWLIPILMGRGPEGTLIARTGAGDLNAYAAIPDPQLGLVPNLLGLYGFWAEGTGRFTSMKYFVPFWPDVLAVILMVCAVGAIVALRQRKGQLAPWVVGLLLAATVALVLEMGVSQPFTSGLVRWLDAHLPLYGGMRDSGKWAALLALVYSQLIALGAVAILDRIRERFRSGSGAQWIMGASVALLLAVPLYFGNGLLFGSHGEIRPSQYPSGWYAADRLLAADLHGGRALFLPWHEYMAMSFIHNQNPVVAPPAPAFFSVPVLVSSNPEVPGTSPPADPDQAAVAGLVREGDRGQWAEVLAAHGIKYILLARELDWRTYTYLDEQVGLTKLHDYGSIVVYRITLAD